MPAFDRFYNISSKVSVSTNKPKNQDQTTGLSMKQYNSISPVTTEMSINSFSGYGRACVSWSGN